MACGHEDSDQQQDRRDRDRDRPAKRERFRCPGRVEDENQSVHENDAGQDVPVHVRLAAFPWVFRRRLGHAITVTRSTVTYDTTTANTALVTFRTIANRRPRIDASAGNCT